MEVFHLSSSWQKVETIRQIFIYPRYKNPSVIRWFVELGLESSLLCLLNSVFISNFFKSLFTSGMKSMVKIEALSANSLKNLRHTLAICLLTDSVQEWGF